MADNTTLPGTGDVIATDDISGVKYQLVKVVWGPLDTATLADTASGKPMPVQQRDSLGNEVLTVASANIVSGVISTAMTGTTSTSLVAAPGASLRNYITQITVSCSHATQGTDVLIQDGSGGTTIWIIPAAAAYGGATIVFNPPLKQPTTNTALYCANVTTGSSTKVSANGFKAA